jgi:aspartyl-tRNA(Asn)/glutamyl-tRNA(Gln) amidotransferase subunit C
VYDFAPIFPLLDSLPMSTLSPEEIAHIARLARLSLTHDEVPAYIDSLTRIIGLVGELERAETGGVEPMSHPLPGQAARMRADTVGETDQRALFQQNAPQVEAGLYLVPRVIE